LQALEARARHARAAERAVGSLVVVLGVGLVGVLLLLGGLAWDALIHARDPGAAHLETSLFSLANPSHLLLLVGGGVVVASLTAASVQALAVSSSPRLASRTTRVLVPLAVLVAALGAGWSLRLASQAELPLASGPLAPAPGPENHGIGVLNSHAPGECRPTNAQKAAAARLVEATEAATAQYAPLEAALAAGFVGPTTQIEPGATEHFSSAANVLDGRILDPSRPESLLYTFTPRGPVLIGVMYLTNHPGEFGPEVGGCLTRWHVHTNVCWSSTTLQPVRQLAPGETCSADTFLYIPPPALHVWLRDVPGGRFAAEVEREALLKAATGG
jgi:hypothetical protein